LLCKNPIRCCPLGQHLIGAGKRGDPFGLIALDRR
jgi:hypothetical protein